MNLCALGGDFSTAPTRWASAQCRAYEGKAMAHFDVIAFQPNRKYTLTKYRGEPFATIVRHSKVRIEMGLNTRVEIFDLQGNLVEGFE